MKILLDTSPAKMAGVDRELVVGKLVTPLTRYANWGGIFAIDNGAFSKFDRNAFRSLLERDYGHRTRCLFVAIPDVVGNGRRTLELYHQRDRFIPQSCKWPLALVAQDGIEDLDIPWMEMSALFIGGIDPFKESKACADLVITAKRLGIHVHVGRVNTAKRFLRFRELGADTCDGSGLAMYDHMIRNISTDIDAAERQGSLLKEGLDGRNATCPV